MSGDQEYRLSEELLETAARWVVLLDERPLTEIERGEFRRWALESDAHRRAFEMAASTWGKSDILKGLSELFPVDGLVDSARQPLESDPVEERANEPPTRRGFAYFAAGLAAAAVLATVYFVGLSGTRTNVPVVSDQVYLTRVGEMKTIDLDDGSTITANTDSRLRVEFSDAERRVLLERGEAYFEVEHDADRPFTVIAGDVTVRAVGTAFSVFRDSGKMQVLVSQGVVDVTQHAPGPGGARPGTAADGHVRVEVGHIAEFGPSEPRIKQVETDEIARRLFWRQGMLAFDGEPLDQVIDEFSRYTTVDIQIASDELRDIRVGGYFDSDDLAGMLTALQSNFGIKVTYLGPDQVLLTAAN